MPLHWLAFPLALATTTPEAGDVFNGREKKLHVPIPRVEAGIAVDGVLDEPVWQRAAVLTGFSQFSPVDGRASTDSTEVLVWYSPTAIHFGIRAFEAHGPASANLSDRDKIFSDDHVQILLGTFNDGRQAFAFAVNPLGVQADGVINESGARSSGGFGSVPQAREQADLSANFVFDSKGRVTAQGYEVEVRIPFKSLRYQSLNVQDWSINIVRQVQHLGHEDSWAPAQRAGASFLAQSGKLTGLRDLRRGLVVDVTPTLVARQEGTERDGGDWGYSPKGPEFGATVRWGVTNNLTLNATMNPDFSQVEADVVALQFDPRQALFFAERRPFFLEGIENFNTPSNLVYSRRIVQPDAAVKLTGKAFGTNIAVLSALDDRSNSRAYANPATRASAGSPRYNIVRAVRDLGGQSRIGMVYTDKVDGGDYNRVGGVDGRLVFGKVWSTRFQGVLSDTRTGSTRLQAPLWNAAVQLDGRAFGFTTSITAIDPDFRSASGFVSRPGIVRAGITPRYNFFPKNSIFENISANILFDGTWKYDQFVKGKSWQDKKLHLNQNFAFKGGWRAGTSLLIETFGFDDDLYRNYYVERRVGALTDTVKFTGVGRIPNFDYVFSFSTPEWNRFSADFFYIAGEDENFFEWASADILNINTNVSWRPTDQLRIDGQYQHQEYNRKDHSTVNIRRVPRLRVEYQATRSIFFRVVGQYDANWQDALRDASRTEGKILVRQPNGTLKHDEGGSDNRVRADWLFSYQPTPGTVVFAGYGSSLQGDDNRRLRELERTQDAFFVKFSYLYRL